MSQVVIENPILNSPYVEPTRHFKFGDDGITDEISQGRRESSYFIPIPRAKKQGKQAALFDTEWTQDRIEPNKLVNRIRERVALWRKGGYVGVTPITRRLLEYWTDPARERKLFFCQIEALETTIYVTEVANKYGDAWIANDLRAANEGSNPGLPRLALKMATGTGKTVVMAMLIAWHALNKLSNTQDPRFSDTFLLIAPGITIRDRLRVLLPTDPSNYYQQRDIVPAYQLEELQQAKILITNFHAFQLRDTQTANKTTKSLLGHGEVSPFTETPDQMVRRVCRELGSKKNIIVINDEAHHCYRRKPDGDDTKLSGDDRKEAEKREEEARIWISGIEAVKAKIGVKTIYDLSATPFFLRGSGWPEGVLFPWVVSDFSLIDAIESGIVKVPRVPVEDNAMTGDLPTYRNLWLRIRDHLPKKGRKTDAVEGAPQLPVELEGALRSLYSNYEKAYKQWEQNPALLAAGMTPPVFIVVCNNTNVSKLVFDYIAGWEKKIGDQTFVQAGELPIFRNDDGAGKWRNPPNTILVDSEQLESGTSMSDDFKRIAVHEIDEFKEEYKRRFPGRDAADLTDEDLLREVMNTVGKPGKLGEHVRCVVSVSMLTEGWDANTVTHILGVRAFGTQLLCEQVVGRALRRMSYAVNDDGKFDPEYAEVYGVPFSFIPTAGDGGPPKPPQIATRVRALEERIDKEITFPRLTGYRYEVPDAKLLADFSPASHRAYSTADVPTRTENAPIVGESSFLTMADLERRRENEVAFKLAKRTLEKYFRDDEEGDKPWLFPQLLAITKQWLAQCVTLKDNTFIQMLLLAALAEDAADRIYRAVVRGTEGERVLKPILRAYDAEGSTRYVDFDTARPVYRTHADKCHISHVVADTESWEQKMAQALEEMDEVMSYVKNQGLNFTIPYVFDGEERQYVPDFIANVDDGRGPEDPLKLIVEVSGEPKRDKAAKVETARTLWIPAVNGHGGLGRWGFIEISDPWDAKNTIRAYLRGLPPPPGPLLRSAETDLSPQEA